jgi:hypothetical protein
MAFLTKCEVCSGETELCMKQRRIDRRLNLDLGLAPYL